MAQPKSFPMARILAPLVLGVFPLVLFYPALWGGDMLWGGDIQTLGLVLATAAQRSLHGGEWPLWFPEIFCGMPGIAATNLVFLHPVDLIFNLLGLAPWKGFGLDAAFEVAAAGLGCYFLLRRFGLSRGAAFLGAFSFSASGTQLSLLYAGHTNNLKAIAMIPWVFWGGLKGHQEGRWAGWALCGLALALQVLGLGLQIFAYTLLALGAFAAWLAWCQASPGSEPAPQGRMGSLRSMTRTRSGSAVLGLTVAGALAFLLSAPQWLPTLAYLPFSWRQDFAYAQFTSWSFDPRESLTWIVPGFWGWRNGGPSSAWPGGSPPTYHGAWPLCLSTEYFGLLPWMLAGAALFAWARPGVAGPWRERLRRPEAFFLGLAVFSFLSGLGKYFPLHHVYFHLPFYQGFRAWARFLCLMTFSVCVLAAFGFDALRSKRASPSAWWGAMAFVLPGLLCSMAAFLLAPSSVAQAAAALTQKLGPGAAASALDLARSSALRSLALLGLLSAVLFFWGRLRSLSLVVLLGAFFFQAFDVSEVSRRFLDFRSPPTVLAEPAILDRLPDPLSAEPYRILDLPGLWPQNTAALFGYETLRGYHGMQMTAPLRLRRALQGRPWEWADLMGVRYVVSPGPLADPGIVALTQEPPYLYQNPSALPRAFLIGAAVTVLNDDAAWTTLAQPSFDVLHCVTVDRDLGLSGVSPQASVQWLGRARNHVDLQVNTDRRGLLVLSQNWVPQWNARVDGQAVGILKLDGGALQGLLLDSGNHRVDLAYSPALVVAGALLAALGLLVLCVVLARPRLGDLLH